MFRCPYCGEKAFSPRIKLGINTKFGQSPRCPKCKRVVFRRFLIGGHFVYGFPLLLVTILSLCGIIVSENTDSALGLTLTLLLLSVFYLFYNYYFCHFDRFNNNSSKEEMICIQLKESNHIWPRIRKGEIYELIPANRRNSFSEDMFTIGMIEHIRQGEIKLRIITAPSKDEFKIKDELIILSKNIHYLAYVT